MAALNTLLSITAASVTASKSNSNSSVQPGNNQALSSGSASHKPSAFQLQERAPKGANATNGAAEDAVQERAREDAAQADQSKPFAEVYEEELQDKKAADAAEKSQAAQAKASASVASSADQDAAEGGNVLPLEGESLPLAEATGLTGSDHAVAEAEAAKLAAATALTTILPQQSAGLASQALVAESQQLRESQELVMQALNLQELELQELELHSLELQDLEADMLELQKLGLQTQELTTGNLHALQQAESAALQNPALSVLAATAAADHELQTMALASAAVTARTDDAALTAVATGLAEQNATRATAASAAVSASAIQTAQQDAQSAAAVTASLETGSTTLSVATATGVAPLAATQEQIAAAAAAQSQVGQSVQDDPLATSAVSASATASNSDSTNDSKGVSNSVTQATASAVTEVDPAAQGRTAAADAAQAVDKASLAAQSATASDEAAVRLQTQEQAQQQQQVQAKTQTEAREQAAVIAPAQGQELETAWQPEQADRVRAWRGLTALESTHGLQSAGKFEFSMNGLSAGQGSHLQQFAESLRLVVNNSELMAPAGTEKALVPGGAAMTSTALSAALSASPAATAETAAQWRADSAATGVQQSARPAPGTPSFIATMQASSFGQPLGQAVNDSGWGESVAQRVTMMAGQKVNSARIELDPPELGAMTIKISVTGDQASVSFQSPHALVRDALEQSFPRLQDMLGQQGLQLADANVSDNSARGQSSGDSRNGVGHAANAVDQEDAELTNTTHTVRVATGTIDYYA